MCTFQPPRACVNIYIAFNWKSIGKSTVAIGPLQQLHRLILEKSTVFCDTVLGCDAYSHNNHWQKQENPTKINFERKYENNTFPEGSKQPSGNLLNRGNTIHLFIESSYMAHLAYGNTRSNMTEHAKEIKYKLFWLSRLRIDGLSNIFWYGKLLSGKLTQNQIEVNIIIHR